MKNKLLLPFLLITVLASAQKSFYNVLDYGAKADGKTLNTEAIRKVINKCAENGGGTVEFPAGTYLTGTIQMKDNVILNLQPGSKILGSKNIHDYHSVSSDTPTSLIAGFKIKNCGITGLGVIDGQGKYLQEYSGHGPGEKDIRPFLLFFKDCKNITMQNITLQYPPAWVQYYLGCDGVTIRSQKVFAHGGENNDMLDIGSGTKNVVISGLIGDSDDDGICLKSEGNEPVEDVVISDCIIRTRTNAIKMGTGSRGGFRDITITNCSVNPTVTDHGYSGFKEGLAGIALEIVDGGIMENINISDITIEETTAPIFIRLGNRDMFSAGHIGSINNIKISNIIAHNASKTGCSIVGEIGYPITNVSISNVKINFKGGGTLKEGLEEKPELVNEYPECVRLGILPAYGFFVRHVDGITFRDVELTYNKEDHRPGMVFNDVQNLKIFNLKAQTSDDTRGKIVLQKSDNVFISGCSPKPAKRFLRIEQNTKNVYVAGNNLNAVRKPVSIDETMKTEDLHIEPNLTGRSTLFEILQPNIRRDSFGMVRIYYPGNVTICYTPDGSVPTPQSIKYTKPFEQIGACTIKAVAVQGDKTSGMAEEKFDTLRVLPVIISPKDQFFNKKLKVTLTTHTQGATIFYTLDGSKPGKNSLIYKKPVSITQATQLRTIAMKEAYKPGRETSSKYETIDKVPGVQYKYYETRWSKLPEFIYLTPLRSGVVDKFTLAGTNNRGSDFGLVMNGFLNIKKAGEYTFYLVSNDGSKLLIDNRKIIDNDGAHPAREKSGRIYLTKGAHLIEVRYFQAGGGKSLEVSVKSPKGEKTELDKNLLIQ